MCRQFQRVWLLAALSFLPLACSTKPTAIKKTAPTDPLLLSKTPRAEAKYGTQDSLVRPEPTPPTMPAGAWVTAPSPTTPTARLGEPGPFRMTSEKRPAEGTIGPASLQGRLERTPDDRCLLRPNPGTPEVPGGVVLLEGHSRLDLLESGCQVHVEGRLVGDRYLVEHVELLKRP